MKATFSAIYTDGLGAAIKHSAREQCPEGYQMETHQSAEMFTAIQEAVNQGIDSHLEAVQFSEFAGQHGKRGFKVTPDTLPVLVRRLLESDGEESNSLASGICETLGIELV